MKSLLFIASVILLFSCTKKSNTKDYTCACTYNTSGKYNTQHVSFPINDATQSSAKSTCDAKVTMLNKSYGSYATCSLQ